MPQVRTLSLALLTLLSVERNMAAESELTPQAPLLLMGRRYPFHFGEGDFAVNGTPIIVHEEYNAGKGTGLTVWDGAIVLAKWLEAMPAELIAVPTLELGCGTGLVGLAAAALGSPSVFLSDLPYALHNTRKTVDANPHLNASAISVVPIDWFDPQELPEVGLVLAADVVWVEELIAPLVATLRAATEQKLPESVDPQSTFSWMQSSSVQHPIVCLSYQSRSTRADKVLFSALDELFERHRVPDDRMPKDYNPPNIAVYILFRR